MKPTERIDTILYNTAKQFHESSIHKIVRDIKKGWSEYNFLFYIGGISVILGNLMGFVGLTAMPVGLFFFWVAGRFSSQMGAIAKEKESSS